MIFNPYLPANKQNVDNICEFCGEEICTCGNQEYEYEQDEN